MTPRYCSQGHQNPSDNRFCRQCGEVLSSPVPQSSGQPEAQPEEQRLAGRYRLVRELGQGGFGRTYLAEDTHRFSERCVLKEFAPQVQGKAALQKAEELFAREAGVLYKLQHPQIPKFRELFRAEVQGQERLFLVQDYVEGQTYQELLETRLQQGDRFHEDEIVQLLRQTLPVLSYLHACGVVHRDISPDNLIQRQSDGLPVLIDFGGVKQIAATVAYQVNSTGSGARSVTRLGKVGYAPIEQLNTGDASPHSDLYALAMTALVLLTGKEPQELLNDRTDWRRALRLGPRLKSGLEGMLDPQPARRYQSASEVLAVLGGELTMPDSHPDYAAHSAPPYAAPDYTPTTAPKTTPVQPAPFQPEPTLAGSPGVGAGQAQSQTAFSPQRKSRRGIGVVLVLLMLGSGGGWWAGRTWLRPWLQQPLNGDSGQVDRPSGNENPGGGSVSKFSQAEQTRKQAIANRRQQLGIDNRFLVSLVDEAFYAKHAIGRPLNDSPDDAPLRTDWDALANQYLDRLQGLSAGVRSRLGRYTTGDLETRRRAVNQVNLSSRALNDLTDSRFFHLFPEAPRNEDLLSKPLGQVWQAIADDELSAVQSGQALERIKFPPGRFSQSVNGTLPPGVGKAYLADLRKDQVLRVTLQAPNKTTSLSIYPPTSQQAPLVEDSAEREWSGKLDRSGLHELVVVSTTSEPLSYQLDVAAADDVSTPKSQ